MPRPAIAARPVLLWLLAAITVWTAVAALFARNDLHTPAACGYIAACAVLFIGAYEIGVRRRSAGLLAASLLPALINGLVVLLQAGDLWSPFQSWLPAGSRVAVIGLLGNPNDVGGYLAPAAVIALAWAVAARAMLPAAAALVLCSAVVASQTLTGVAAVIAGAATIAVILLGRRAAVLVPAAIALAAAVILLSPIRNRVPDFAAAIREGDINRIMSNRSTPFAAAFEMIRDNPLLGVGPGGYGPAYYDYKIAAEEKHPVLMYSMARAVNFGEAHNEHLEIAAEAGLPAYVIFAGVVVVILRFSLRQKNPAFPAAYVRLSGPGLVATLLVSAAAHFPLQIAASASLYACSFGLILAWSDNDGD